ncbi:MAG: hypothetical protein IKV32_02035 [Muribaculaceae bacterium]|nr:hypothetical protein [Muribaculaceae bacterium]
MEKTAKEVTCFYFEMNKYKLNDVESYTYDECLAKNEYFYDTLKEFEEYYNSEDSSDLATYYYIRLFQFDQKYDAYLIYNDDKFEMQFIDGQSCSFNGNYICFEDDRDNIYLEDIPTEILEKISSKVSYVKKVSLSEYEKIHNQEDFPMYITFRKSDKY